MLNANLAKFHGVITLLDNIYLMPVNALSLAIIAQMGRQTGVTLLDNNERCNGSFFRGIKVESPKFHEIPTDATVIICSFLSKKAMTYQLKKMGIHNILQYKDVLSESDYDKLADAFGSITEDELRAISPQHVSLLEVGTLKIRNAQHAVKSKIVINNVNLVPTLNCTLRCKDCSTLIPYFDKQAEFETPDVCSGIRRLSELADKIVMCTILGGEPFLHKDIGTIAGFAAELGNVESVAINTNGTLLPTQETCEQLKGLDSFSVIVSDYGKLSRNKDELINRLHSYGIKTAILENLSWYDFCKILDAENRTVDEIEETYNMCSMICAGLVKNKFSKCYPALLLELLGAIPPDSYGEESVIDLNTATREDLVKHLNSDSPMQACAVCSGKSRLAKQIPPAVQTGGPMTYRKYK